MTWLEYQELLKRHAEIRAAFPTGKGDISGGDDRATKDGGGRLNRATTFTVFNDGGAPLTVSSIALNAPAAWITWWPPAPFDVQPGQSRKVAVYINYDLAPASPTTRRFWFNPTIPMRAHIPMRFLCRRPVGRVGGCS